MIDGRTREAYLGLLDLVRTPQNRNALDLLLGVHTRLLAQRLRGEGAELLVSGLKDPGPSWASSFLDETARSVMTLGAEKAMLDP